MGAALAWMDRAACHGTPVDLFFPTQGGPNAVPRNICKQCPVVDECAKYAINDPEIYGIWGDTTETDRAQIRLERRRQSGRPVKRGPVPGTETAQIIHGTYAGYAKHRKRNETPCIECKRAKATYKAEWKARNT